MEISKKLIKSISSKDEKMYYMFCGFKLVFYRIFPKLERIERRIKLSEISPEFKCLTEGQNEYRFKICSYEINIMISDIESLISKFFKDEIELINTQKDSERGHPDYKVKYKDYEFYIELKINEDGIRDSQVEWIKKNKADVWFIFVKPNKIKL